jgi:cellulose biosynthesis protein BcsQ
VPVRIVPDPLTAAPVIVHFEQVRAGGGTLAVLRAGPLLWKARRDEVVRHLERARIDADVVLVDTVPVLGDITLAAAAAADLVIIPTAPTADDLDAVDHVVAAIQESIDPDKAFRVVLTKAIAGRRNTRDAVQLLTERYGSRLYPTIIPHRTSGETANMYLRPAVLYDEVMGDGSLAAAYRKLTELVMQDLNFTQPQRRPSPRVVKKARA